jgi:hypothetical protein
MDGKRLCLKADLMSSQDDLSADEEVCYCGDVWKDHRFSEHTFTPMIMPYVWLDNEYMLRDYAGGYESQGCDEDEREQC